MRSVRQVTSTFVNLLGLTLAIPGIAQNRPQDVPALLAEARALIEKGRSQAAIEALEAMGQTDDPRVVLVLGVACYHARSHQRAIELLEGVTAKFPEGSLERHEAIQILGLSHYILGQYEKALPFLEQTKSWAAQNTELTYVTGMTCLRTDRTDAARDAFARLFGLPNDSAGACLVTAQMMLRLESLNLAEAELQQALRKEPRLPQVHYLMAQIALDRSNYDEAADLLRRELTLNPANAMALFLLGDTYARQLRWNEAVSPLLKAIWLNPYYSGSYLLLGKVYARKGELGTAEGMLRHAIQMEPNNKSAHYLLGNILREMKREAEAKEELAIVDRLPGKADP